MGVTDISIKRINMYLKPTDSILLIGCQNCYWPENYGEIAQDYFRSLGHKTTSIDIYPCNGAEIADLRDDLGWLPEWDMVNQCGTIEHVDGGLYWPFRNIHEACKVGGIMIHENPKAENWPLHGYHYFHAGFFGGLAHSCGYELIELADEVSMGNYETGWNVSAVFKKVDNEPFISEEMFSLIYNEYITSK